MKKFDLTDWICGECGSPNVEYHWVHRQPPAPKVRLQDGRLSAYRPKAYLVEACICDKCGNESTTYPDVIPSDRTRHQRALRVRSDAMEYYRVNGALNNRKPGDAGVPQLNLDRNSSWYRRFCE